MESLPHTAATRTHLPSKNNDAASSRKQNKRSCVMIELHLQALNGVVEMRTQLLKPFDMKSAASQTIDANANEQRRRGEIVSSTRYCRGTPAAFIFHTRAHLANLTQHHVPCVAASLFRCLAHPLCHPEASWSADPTRGLPQQLSGACTSGAKFWKTLLLCTQGTNIVSY